MIKNHTNIILTHNLYTLTASAMKTLNLDPEEFDEDDDFRDKSSSCFLFCFGL